MFKKRDIALFCTMCLFSQYFRTVTLTCNGCSVTANSLLRFSVGGVAQAIQLSVDTPAYSTASGNTITDSSITSRCTHIPTYFVCDPFILFFTRWRGVTHLYYFTALLLRPTRPNFLVLLLLSICSIFQPR